MAKVELCELYQQMVRNAEDYLLSVRSENESLVDAELKAFQENGVAHLFSGTSQLPDYSSEMLEVEYDFTSLFEKVPSFCKDLYQLETDQQRYKHLLQVQGCEETVHVVRDEEAVKKAIEGFAGCSKSKGILIQILRHPEVLKKIVVTSSTAYISSSFEFYSNGCRNTSSLKFSGDNPELNMMSFEDVKFRAEKSEKVHIALYEHAYKVRQYK